MVPIARARRQRAVVGRVRREIHGEMGFGSMGLDCFIEGDGFSLYLQLLYEDNGGVYKAEVHMV